MSKHIIDFQKKHGLTPDGIIGKNTLRKMKEVWGLTNEQLAHFMAQTHHETGGFKLDTENLNYSASGLLKVFEKYFGVGKLPASQYANKPEAIANVVYANRMGNTEPCDGYTYRGRGALQLTGKDNYKAFAEFLKNNEVLTNPDIVATKYFWETALFYFTRNKLWGQMKYTDKEAVLRISKAVNMGSTNAKGTPNGLKDRENKFDYYYNITKGL